MCRCRRWATPVLDLGVTPRLVFNVRNALDHAWEAWDLPEAWRERARDFCRHVQDCGQRRLYAGQDRAL